MKTLKVKKPKIEIIHNKPAKKVNVKSKELEDFEDENEVENSDEEPADESDALVTEESAPDMHVDTCRVVMIKTIRAPHVGHYSVRSEMGIEFMVEKNQYTVPLNVGIHLEDKKVAVVIRDQDAAATAASLARIRPRGVKGKLGRK